MESLQHEISGTARISRRRTRIGLNTANGIVPSTQNPVAMQNDYRFQKYYFSKPSFIDGTTQFHGLIREYVNAGSSVLEIGAGPKNITSDFLASFCNLYGVDVSEEVHDNPALSRAVTYDGNTLPFGDCEFDACVSNYVLEHIVDPARHFAEIARVLKPDGVYVLRTPNLRHYVAVISALLPNRLHGIANGLRSMAADAHHPYPTTYRANTTGCISRLALASGLQFVRLIMIEKEPSYGSSHPFLFYPMLAYERLVNSSELFAPLRINILAVLKKSTAN